MIYLRKEDEHLKTWQDFRNILRRIDKKGYKAYKELTGEYLFDGFILFCDHVQPDPFAPPSRIRVRVSQEKACIPEKLFDTRVKRVALEDYFTREMNSAIKKIAKGRRGTGKSGLFECISVGQEILERTSIKITKEYIEARLSVGLPARGRTIIAKEAEEMFFVELPEIVEKGLIYKNINRSQAEEQVSLVVDQEYIRQKLKENRLVCFVADDSVLPRESGISDRPLRLGNVIPFKSPESLRVSFSLPSGKMITGMGIPEGVTMITGGGYHGKSTLLKAIERGVYNHIAGDGREYVITREDAVKIRAEDGRFIEKVDISMFIDNLPGGGSTSSFSTDNASGSTSQAANIIEAIEAGTSLLLLDEDTCATNFMIRDARIQRLISKEKEPITPFIDRVQQLYKEKGISTIVVIGGSGDYFDIVDRVILMENYLPYDVTSEAKKIALEFETKRKIEVINQPIQIKERVPLQDTFNQNKNKKDKVKVTVETITFGYDEIDLDKVEQLVDKNQTAAIGLILKYAAAKFIDGRRNLVEIVNAVYDKIEKHGLDIISPFYPKHPGNLALPRKQEVFAAINRYRRLKIK